MGWDQITQIFIYDPAQPMLFNSRGFLVLFTLFYAGYVLLLGRINPRLFYTFSFSLFFYYKSSGVYFLLLLISTVVDFGLGHLIYRSQRKSWKLYYLILSLLANLGMLAYFKYAGFFTGLFGSLTGVVTSPLEIFLPVGISFFTFQTMSYSIDIYRGYLKPVSAEVTNWAEFWKALLDFAFFVTYFPQLVAGPIVRAAEFLPQIRMRPGLSRSQAGSGLFLIIGGLIKKAIISDYVSVNFVDRVFENPTLYSGLENLLAVYGYAIQIYCDFSGYSDMAIGLALLMGFQLPENFRTPYRAVDLQAFWRRWHISLSRWLRDYLYISLGGNRKGKLRTYINLMLTMLLGGLWHGAGWVFIFWGGLHGVGLALERYLRETGRIVWKNPATRAVTVLLVLQSSLQILLLIRWGTGLISFESLLGLSRFNLGLFFLWVLLWRMGVMVDQRLGSLQRHASRFSSGIMTFHFVCFCWVLFRAGAIGAPLPPLLTVNQVLTQIGIAFQGNLAPQVWRAYSSVILLIGFGYILHFLPVSWMKKAENWYAKAPPIIQSLILALVIWTVVQIAGTEVVPFIYFQF